MKRRCLIIALVCFVVAIGTYCFADKQINLVATEKMNMEFSVVRSTTGYTCNITVSGSVLDSDGNVVKSEQLYMNIDDLGPTMKAEVIKILKAANKKLNLQAIGEDVDTLPELQ